MMWYIKKIGCVLGHICSWKILTMSDFMVLQAGGIPQFVMLQGEGTCG